MPLLPPKAEQTPKFPEKIFNKEGFRRLICRSAAVIGLIFLLENCHMGYQPPVDSPKNLYGTQPLVMEGGDPYIRALMRTISASEANDRQPYTIIYGGDHVSDLSRHPNRCVPIVAGPNIRNCTTAAGRYQMLNTTWDQNSKRYHPAPSGFMLWKSYSFEPKFQDAVVYAWLSDRQAWGVDISALLRQGKLNQVLRLLSGTWTSLGYGIENNSMSGKLPAIYQKMLKEELQAATNGE